MVELTESGSIDAFEHLGDHHVYQGHLWRVVSGRFRSPTGETFHRDIVRSPGAVAVVPVLGEGADLQVVLLRQYRAAFDRYVLEIPAGMRDVEGEPPAETARRELKEETGYVAGSLDLLHEFYPSPGMTDATLHVFLGSALVSSERQAHGPEEHDMEVLHLLLNEAVDLVLSGEIKDAKSIIGILLAQRVLRA